MGDQGSPDPVGRIRLTVFENGDINVTREIVDGKQGQSATYETRFDTLHAVIRVLRSIDYFFGPLFSREYKFGGTDGGDLRPKEPPKPPPEQQDRG